MLQRVVLPALIFAVAVSAAQAVDSSGLPTSIAGRLELAGDNADQLRRAWHETPADERPGMQFLLQHMPERDLKSLPAEFLRENVEYAYRAWREAPWGETISEEMFLNNVLPYASVNESRDRWRKDFYERFAELIADAQTPGEAAAMLNQKLFQQTGVRYSTKRRRPDQGPYETLESGMATCTGLSILLIDACRALGVPARFVGTPLWSDNSGNHSWVEVWDGDWHFTGAAEPTGSELNKAWFVGRAAKAEQDEPRHAIYATSFKTTPLEFPCVWSRRVDFVFAVNVTARYTAHREELPEGKTLAQFRVVDPATGERQACDLRVAGADGQVVCEIESKDERFDTNDHATAVLELGRTYRVEIGSQTDMVEQEIRLQRPDQLFTFTPAATKDAEADDDAEEVVDPVQALRRYLATPLSQRVPLAESSFAQASLTKAQAEEAKELLWLDYAESIREERKAELESRRVRLGEVKMRFDYKVFGEQPEGGRSLYISLHGGGGAPTQVNDRQWENQKRLYQPEEGVYLVPRAPTDTWNLWHQPHIDGLFERLIENFVVAGEVNPNRVYLVGYSAGGDGVYQLAPRMADRWAACAMMAGHPNDASPLSLRNIGFALFMGGKDAAYSRNKVAEDWKNKLAALQEEDPAGYRHQVTIYPDKGHWMDGEDKSALPWMAEFVRDPVPKKLVWKQDDVRRLNHYWLAMDIDSAAGRPEVRAEVEGQAVTIDTGDVDRLTIRLDDRLVDLDREVRVVTPDGQTRAAVSPKRTIATLAKTLHERGDREFAFPVEFDVELR